MFDIGSPVLSGNEVLQRSERAGSLNYSTSSFYDSPVDFRSERDTFVQLMLGERESEFIDINQMRFVFFV